MRYAIISDVHSNLEAFESVISEIRRESPAQILFLGDIVGYGPDPNECIEKIKEAADIVLIGNHDHAAIGLTDVSYFNTYARAAIEWTMSQLNDRERSYLSELPMTGEFTSDDIFLVHATPRRPQDWNYIFTMEDIIENFECFTRKICLLGHSHIPVVIAMDNSGRLGVLKDEVTIEEGHRYIINVGSVGQPRDGNPDAAYVIYDTQSSIVRIKRVSYDYHITQEKMKKAGLPDYLINRLATGR